MSHILPSKLGKTLFKFNVTPFSQVRNTLTHYIYKIKQYQLSISFSVTSSLHNYPTLCRFEKQTRKIVPTIQYCYTITNTEFTFFLISFRHYSMSSISIDIVRLISPLCQVFCDLQQHYLAHYHLKSFHDRCPIFTIIIFQCY